MFQWCSRNRQFRSMRPQICRRNLAFSLGIAAATGRSHSMRPRIGRPNLDSWLGIAAATGRSHSMRPQISRTNLVFWLRITAATGNPGQCGRTRPPNQVSLPPTPRQTKSPAPRAFCKSSQLFHLLNGSHHVCEQLVQCGITDRMEDDSQES